MIAHQVRRSCRRQGWLLLAVALLATACSGSATVESSAVSTPSTPTAEPAPRSPEPTPAPTAVAEPAAEPTAPPSLDEGPDQQVVVPPIDAGFEPPPELVDTPFAVEAQSWVLDNGLTVLLQPNAAPGGQVQFRLVVNAGSVHESPDSLGSAHFLEHMLFNGTERWPGNSLVPVLESFGSGFGADVNAYTSFDETVYKLTTPTRDSAVLDTAVAVLFDWASAATIEPDAVDAERGVVREEYRRSQETVGGRLSASVREVIFAGTNRLGRDPIGTLDSINTLDAGQLRAFYERWYQPSNMTLIAVGDFRIDPMLNRIRSEFGGWQGDAVAETAVDAPGPFAEPVFDVFTDPELTQSDVSISWRLDAPAVDDRLSLRDQLVRRVAVQLLETRVFERSERGETVWTSANTSQSRIQADSLIVGASAAAPAGELSTALDELLIAFEELRQHAVDPNEFERAIERLRSQAEQVEAESAGRQDRDIAEDLVDFALDRGITPDPDEQLAATLAGLGTVRPIDVQAFFDTVLRTEPYVLVTASSVDADILPEPEALSAVYDARIGFAVEPPQTASVSSDRLMDAPDPAAIVERNSLAELDATVVTFDNGLRLAVRESAIVRNQVEFVGWSRGGFFHEDADVAPILGGAASLVLPSGFGSVDPVDLDRLLGDSVVSLTANVGRATEELSGESAVDDLEVLFQLIHLQMTDSTITELQERRFVEVVRPIVERPEANPALAADVALWRLRYGDSPWFRLVPTVEDLDAIDIDVQLDAWNRRFGNAGDFAFVFVGDVDPDVVIELGSRYLGTLPSTEDREQQLDRDPGIPEANLVETVAVGVGDQGRLRINWESPYPFTIEAEVEARVVEFVVDARLRDLVREQLGASYAPQAEVTVLSEPKSWVDSIIELEGDPERLDEISGVVRDELARIRAGELEQSYLDLVVDQLSEDWRFSSNTTWMDRLTFHLANPERDPGEFRRRTAIAEGLTISDVAAATAVIFPESRSVEVRMVPAG